MRILYSHRIQSHDGQSVHIDEMVAAFREAGHEVKVVGPSFYASAGFGTESRAVALVRRLLPAALAELAELAYNVPAWRRLARAASSFHPDLIYERYNLYYLAGAWIARRRHLPFYLEVNAPLADERARFGGIGLGRLARAAERFVWRAADRVFAVTGDLGRRIAAVGVPGERIHITPNGVDPSRFPPRPPPREDEELVLGFIGFARPWHGLDTVIRGIAESGTGLSLVVAGEGPACADLHILAHLLGCAERVRFVGLTPRDAVPSLLAGFDIALQPRALAYASPLKLFEYMAAGSAIVAPDQPNIREIVAHAQTALLFDPASPEAMWQAIARLARDAPLRRRLGEAARAEILRRDFTWRGNAARVVAAAEADIARRADGAPAALPASAG
ncbi:MAG TPA: glycosyltransferase family 4 protein [Acetobacteraceae bacterium]|nr:glycosyltransferase family 4 protein [Acetobacteraceae bacterium]